MQCPRNIGQWSYGPMAGIMIKKSYSMRDGTADWKHEEGKKMCCGRSKREGKSPWTDQRSNQGKIRCHYVITGTVLGGKYCRRLIFALEPLMYAPVIHLSSLLNRNKIYAPRRNSNNQKRSRRGLVVNLSC